jgi:hypothetical protein
VPFFMSAVQPPAPHDICDFAGEPGLLPPASTAVAPTPATDRPLAALAGAGAAFFSSSAPAACLGVSAGAAAAGGGGAAAGAALVAPAPSVLVAFGAGLAAAAGSGAAFAPRSALLHPADALTPRTASAATNVSKDSEGLRIGSS